jgi:type IV pilus assembly protein PilZ
MDSPKALQVAERRSTDRATAVLRVDYTRMNAFFADYTQNISKGGTFLRTSDPLDAGTELTLVMTVPDSTVEDGVVRIELTGRVKRVVRSPDSSASSPAGMGIEFVFADDEQRRHLEEIVAAMLRRAFGDDIAEEVLGQD